MADPPHYVTSSDYQPGLMNDVGVMAFSIMVIVAFFILVMLGSRLILRKSRGLSPATRKLLRLMSGLTRPSAPFSLGRGHRARLGARRKAEDHYRMKPALASGQAAPASASASERSAPAAAAMAAAVPEVAERPFVRKRTAPDVAQLPEEAWPFYAEDEIAAVVEVLRSGKVNQWTGTKVTEFERVYTRYLRNGRAIALANGSVALELALRAFGIGPGDEVVVTPRSFVASAFCVRLVGAVPVFADVDPDSGNINAATIAEVLTERTKAVIPVHLGGWPADMPAIMALARARGLLVIEDCAQAHGAEIEGLPVGSFGDAAAFSFCQDKIISTGGEGGLVTFRDDSAYEWAWSYKDHGKDRGRAQAPAQPGFRWVHDRVGTNWRMTEPCAAIGLVQMNKLPQWHARRVRNADIWAEALAPIPGLRVPRPAASVEGGYYKFYAYVDSDVATRDSILAAAAAAGVRVFSGSCSEVYREAAFADMKVGPLPVAKALGDSSLMFEVHPTLDTRRLRDRADIVAEVVRNLIG